MDNKEIVEGLLEFAKRDLLHGAADDLDADTPLLELGVLDSLSMVGLLAYVDEAFGVKIPEDDVLPDHFDTLRSIAALVADRRDDDVAVQRAARSELHQLVALQETYGLRSETHTLPSGASAHILAVDGDGPTWVLVPALGNPSTSFGPALRTLANQQRAIAVDMPGFGLSEIGTSAYGPGAPVHRDHVDFLAELIDQRCEGDVVLVGSSAGAMVAAEIARRTPGCVRALVVTGFGLIADPKRWWQGLQEMSDSPEAFLDAAYYRAPQLTPALERLLHEVLARPAYRSFLDPHAIEAMRDTFDDLTVPVLFVAGRDDRIIPAEAVEAAVKRVPGAQIEWMARCGHFAPVERSEAFLWLVRSFLSKLDR